MINTCVAIVIYFCRSTHSVVTNHGYNKPGKAVIVEFDCIKIANWNFLHIRLVLKKQQEAAQKAEREKKIKVYRQKYDVYLKVKPITNSPFDALIAATQVICSFSMFILLLFFYDLRWLLFLRVIFKGFLVITFYWIQRAYIATV